MNIMKKNLVYSLLATTLIFAAACQKDNDESEMNFNPKNAPALISKIIENMVGSGQNAEIIRENFYDDNNKLTKTLQSIKDTINYYYDTEDRLIKVVQTGDNWPHQNDITYGTNNVITEEESYNSGLGFRAYSRYEYTTDKNGKIISEIDYYFDQNEEIWVKSKTYRTYTWQNGNLTNRTSFNETNLKSINSHNEFRHYVNLKSTNDTVSNNETIVFNNKINPYAYSSTNIGFISKNLITSSQSISTDGRYALILNITYEYGSNGFPEKSVEVEEYKTFIPGTDPFVNTTTYTTHYEYINLK